MFDEHSGGVPEPTAGPAAHFGGADLQVATSSASAGMSTDSEPRMSDAASFYLQFYTEYPVSALQNIRINHKRPAWRAAFDTLKVYFR